MKTSITSNLRPLSRALSAFLIAATPLWAIPRNASAQANGIEQGGSAQTLGTTANTTPPQKKVIAFFVVNAFEVAKYNYITGHPTRVLEPVVLVIIGAALLFIPSVFHSTGATLFSAGTQTTVEGFDSAGWVGSYDATTGTLINPSFILFQPPPGVRVDKCTGLASKGDTLFVMFQLHGPGPGKNGIVGTYDAKTGAPINVNFITGLDQPSGLALNGNTLFVTNFGTNSSDGTVGTYNAKTGAVINANFITGLSNPAGLALLGNTVLVAEESKNTVAKYDAKTGALINANFITGLSHPIFLALLGDTLFVANFFSGTIGKYNAETGAVINANFITGFSEPVSIAVKSVK